MKAQLVDSIRPGDWVYEIKCDGYRALALRGGHETRILSRNQKDLGKKFPEIASSIAELRVIDQFLPASDGIVLGYKFISGENTSGSLPSKTR
jgi:ATP-dependent DNA ligase